MKLIWFSHFVPYPPLGGSAQRSFNLIRRMSERYETILVALNLQNEPGEAVADYRKELRKYCSRVEIWELPWAWKGREWIARLSLTPLYRPPYGCRAIWSRELEAAWKQILADNPQALVHYDSIDLALYSEGSTGFRSVLNHHNCESAMAHRRAEKEPNPVKKVFLWDQARKLERLEERICHQFNVNLVVSDLDARLLHSRNPRMHYHIVENGTDTGYFFPSIEEEEPNSLIFAGSLRWYPNISAVSFFAREIWPRLKRACPGVRLYLAGRGPVASMVRWSNEDKDVVLVANPEDMRPWLARAAVFVCPIVDGGGTRLKILDAMAMGKAVVSTTIGCEGLQVTHGDNILVADEPEDFAREIASALQNEALRQQLGTKGRALVERDYSWEAIARQLDQAYQCALGHEACGRGQ